MKKTVSVLMLWVLFIGVNAFAASGFIEFEGQYTDWHGNPQIGKYWIGICTDGNLKIGRGPTPCQDVGFTLWNLFSNEPPFAVIPRLIPGQMLPDWGSAKNPSFTFDGDRDTGMYHPGQDIIGFTSNGIEQVRIDNTGNVGIGTTTPAEKLEVAGAIKVADTLSSCSSSNAGAIKFVSPNFYGCNGSAWVQLNN